MTKDQRIIAQVDVPAPGTTGAEGIFAFRAGAEIPPDWAEQHASFLHEIGAVVKASAPKPSTT